jgi:xylulokinase
MNVTVATEAVRNLFGWSLPQLDAAVADAPPGAEGLLFLPYLQGERTPNLPGGSGVFHGLTPRNMKPALMARAVMEGVTLGMAYGLERMKELGIAPSEIRLTGGGSKSPVWRQICATIFNCPVVTLVESEGAALGAAIQPLASVQTSKSISEWAADIVKTNSAERVEPDKRLAPDYAASRQKHMSLMQTLAQGRLL